MSVDIQEDFLGNIRDNKISVTVFLVNGVKLQGIITGYNDVALLLRRDGHTQLIYKHAISTVMPAEVVEIETEK